MTSKIEMTLDEALAWIKLGIENKNYDAARNMLNDLIKVLEARDAAARPAQQ